MPPRTATSPTTNRRPAPIPVNSDVRRKSAGSDERVDSTSHCPVTWTSHADERPAERPSGGDHLHFATIGRPLGVGLAHAGGRDGDAGARSQDNAYQGLPHTTPYEVFRRMGAHLHLDAPILRG